jgi:hypothetical protein
MEVEIPQGEALEEALGLSDQRKLKGKLASSGLPPKELKRTARPPTQIAIWVGGHAQKNQTVCIFRLVMLSKK